MSDEVDQSQLEAASRYADKLELVFREYEKSLDLEIALTVVPLSDYERAQLVDDQDLLARIAICDAKVRGDLMTRLRNLAEGASSEGVRLSALRDLGRSLYPKRFKDAGDNPPSMPAVIHYEVVEAPK